MYQSDMFRSRSIVLRDSSYESSINNINNITSGRLNMESNLHWISVFSMDWV
jgi:hypothetical protein